MTYNDKVVRQFALMTVVWGIVGMLVGVLIAAQLIWPALDFNLPWLSYGRIRPLHTNAVIFAFGGSALFATSYYVVQRTCHVRLFSDFLAALTFWGWQLVIVLAALTLPMGLTEGKEYAELIWPIDVLIAIVWIAYAIVFFGTLATRRVRHIYVANWFYASFIITVAILHIVNSLAVPVSLTQSYPIYAGVVDAMVQWWYGHNAVGFFLTAGFLGMMYYFVPKQAGRPIYSYRLSVVHFWALISIYMWAGPHHLHYSTLPDWAQSLGMVFSVLLLAPSWGGMINGIMTLSGAWAEAAHRSHPAVHDHLPVVLWHVHLRRADDVHQERQRPVALHRLDHRARTLGRSRLGRHDLHGLPLQPDPASLRPRVHVQHASHRDPLLDLDDRRRALHRVHVDRGRHAGLDVARREYGRHAHLQFHRDPGRDQALLRRPARRRRAVPDRLVDHGLERLDDRAHGRTCGGEAGARARGGSGLMEHQTIEKKAGLLGVLIALVVSIGGLAEIIPLMASPQAVEPAPGVAPYPALQLEGRDIYVREGCYNCHSQMIRPFRAETERYGHYSLAGEAVYDHPFQFGSKRTGPDLARVGGRYTDEWMRRHLLNPRDLVPESNMPAFPWLEAARLDERLTPVKMRRLRMVGVPYTDAEIASASEAVKGHSEMDALVAYLQGLGRGGAR